MKYIRWFWISIEQSKNMSMGEYFTDWLPKRVAVTLIIVVLLLVSKHLIDKWVSMKYTLLIILISALIGLLWYLLIPLGYN